MSLPNALLSVLIGGVLAVVSTIAFHAFFTAYPADYKVLSSALHSVDGATRNSGGAYLQIATTSPATISLTSGVVAGGSSITNAKLGSVPTVSGVTAGTPAVFSIDPDDVATLNGASCTTVTITVDSQSETVTCNPWTVNP